MKFISLFAGVGGFDLALERVGHECVYANEWDKYCKIIYDRHFRNKGGFSNQKESPKTNGYQTKSDVYASGGSSTLHYDFTQYGLDTRSITDVTTDEIPDHDLLVGGFPCQSFSIAGKRGGFNDTRGTMFFEIARILQAKKPRLFILENVKGLLSHDNGATFKTIITTLTELGYDCQWQVLNSKNFGVPQNRERVFIVGHLRGTSRPEVFPVGRIHKETNELQQEAEGEQQRVQRNTETEERDKSSIENRGGYEGRPSLRQLNQPTHSNDRVYGQDGISPTLNTMQGGRRQPKVELEARIRRLTPTECERLQGFPDGWTEGVSDTQRYKMMGNAVTVNVVEYLLQNIK